MAASGFQRSLVGVGQSITGFGRLFGATGQIIAGLDRSLRSTGTGLSAASRAFRDVQTSIRSTSSALDTAGRSSLAFVGWLQQMQATSRRSTGDVAALTNALGRITQGLGAITPPSMRAATAITSISRSIQGVQRDVGGSSATLADLADRLDALRQQADVPLVREGRAAADQYRQIAAALGEVQRAADQQAAGAAARAERLTRANEVAQSLAGRRNAPEGIAAQATALTAAQRQAAQLDAAYRKISQDAASAARAATAFTEDTGLDTLAAAAKRADDAVSPIGARLRALAQDAGRVAVSSEPFVVSLQRLREQAGALPTASGRAGAAITALRREMGSAAGAADSTRVPLETLRAQLEAISSRAALPDFGRGNTQQLRATASELQNVGEAAQQQAERIGRLAQALSNQATAAQRIARDTGNANATTLIAGLTTAARAATTLRDEYVQIGRAAQEAGVAAQRVGAVGNLRESVSEIGRSFGVLRSSLADVGASWTALQTTARTAGTNAVQALRDQAEAARAAEIGVNRVAVAERNVSQAGRSLQERLGQGQQAINERLRSQQRPVAQTQRQADQERQRFSRQQLTPLQEPTRVQQRVQRVMVQPPDIAGPLRDEMARVERVQRDGTSRMRDFINFWERGSFNPSAFVGGLKAIGSAFSSLIPSAAAFGKALLGIIPALGTVARSLLGVVPAVGSLVAAFAGSAIKSAVSFVGGLATTVVGLGRAALSVVPIVGGFLRAVVSIGAGALGAVGSVVSFGTGLLGIGRATGPVKAAGDAMGGVVKRAAELGLAVLGLQGLQKAAETLTDSIIGLNSRFSDSVATIEAFTKSSSVAADIASSLRQRADFTPFPTTEIVKAGEQLISSAHGQKDALLGLIETGEQLAALKPQQGLEGAAFALREAVSGDFESVVERFDLSREAIGRWRASGVSNIEAVRGAMREMGVDSRLVTNLTNTFTGAASTFNSFFSEVRRSLSEGVFNALLQQMTDFANFVRENGESIYQTFQRIGSVLGGGFSALIEHIRGFLSAAGGVGNAITEIARSFEMGDFQGVVSNIGRAMGEAITAIRTQLDGFAQAIFGTGERAMTRFGDGIISGLSRAVSTVSNAVADVIGGFLGASRGGSQDATAAGTDLGASFVSGVSDAVTVGSGQAAQAVRFISDALRINVPGQAGQDIQEWRNYYESIRQAGAEKITEQQKAVDAAVQAAADGTAASRQRLADERKKFDQITKDTTEQVRALAQRGPEALAVSTDDLQGFVRSVLQSASSADSLLNTNDELTRSFQDLDAHLTANGGLWDAETEKLVRYAEQASLTARIRNPQVAQEQQPPIRVPDLSKVIDSGFFSGKEFQRQFAAGLESGMSAVQQQVNGTVATIGAADKALTLEGARAALKDAWGKTADLNSVLKQVDVSASQVERVMSGITLKAGELQFAMEGIKNATDAQTRPLEAQLRGLESQRDFAAEQESLQLELRDVELQRARIAAEGNREERERLNLLLKQIDRKRDQITTAAQLRQVEAAAAGLEGIGQDALTQHQRLLLLTRDRLRAQLDISKLPENEGATDEIDRERTMIGLRKEELDLQVRAQELTLEVQKAPIEEKLQKIKNAYEDQIGPLQQQLDILQHQGSALDLYRQQLQNVRADAQLALQSANAGFIVKPTPLDPNDESFENLKRQSRTLGRDMADNLGVGFGDWMATNFANVAGTGIGAILGGSLLGPIGAVAGGILGSSIGMALSEKLASQNIGLEEIQARVQNGLTDLSDAIKGPLDAIGGAIQFVIDTARDFWEALDKEEVADTTVRIFGNLRDILFDLGDLAGTFSGKLDPMTTGLGDAASNGERLADAFENILGFVERVTGAIDGVIKSIQGFANNPIVQALMPPGSQGTPEARIAGRERAAALGNNLPFVRDVRIATQADKRQAEANARDRAEIAAREAQRQRDEARLAPARERAAQREAERTTAQQAAQPAATRQDVTARNALRQSGLDELRLLEQRRTLLRQVQSEAKAQSADWLEAAKRAEAQATRATAMGDNATATAKAAEGQEAHAQATAADARAQAAGLELDKIGAELQDARTVATGHAVDSAKSAAEAGRGAAASQQAATAAAGSQAAAQRIALAAKQQAADADDATAKAAALQAQAAAHAADAAKAEADAQTALATLKQQLADLRTQRGTPTTAPQEAPQQAPTETPQQAAQPAQEPRQRRQEPPPGGGTAAQQTAADTLRDLRETLQPGTPEMTPAPPVFRGGARTDEPAGAPPQEPAPVEVVIPEDNPVSRAVRETNEANARAEAARQADAAERFLRGIASQEARDIGGVPAPRQEPAGEEQTPQQRALAALDDPAAVDRFRRALSAAIVRAYADGQVEAAKQLEAARQEFGLWPADSGPEVRQRFEDAGKEAVAGFQGALEEGDREAAGASLKLGDAAVGALSDALQIGSPSRVFADLGGEVVAGFAQGLSGIGAVIDQAMKDAAPDAAAGDALRQSSERIVKTWGVAPRMMRFGPPPDQQQETPGREIRVTREGGLPPAMTAAADAAQQRYTSEAVAGIQTAARGITDVVARIDSFTPAASQPASPQGAVTAAGTAFEPTGMGNLPVDSTQPTATSVPQASSGPMTVTVNVHPNAVQVTSDTPITDATMQQAAKQAASAVIVSLAGALRKGGRGAPAFSPGNPFGN